MPSVEKQYKDTAVSEIEFFADDIDPVEASRVYQAYGCLVVRGLMKDYVEQIQADIETIAQESIAQLDLAQAHGWNEVQQPLSMRRREARRSSHPPQACYIYVARQVRCPPPRNAEFLLVLA